MTAASRSLPPAQLVLTLLCGGLLSTASLEAPTTIIPGDQSPYTTLDSPTLDVRLGRRQLTLSGTAASRAHEAAIQSLLAEFFVDTDVVARLQPGVLVPDSWQSLSLALLRAVATLESAEASIGPSAVSIRGVTASPGEYSARLAGLRSLLPAMMSIDERVTNVVSDLPFPALCAQTFTGFGRQTVEFERASATLRTTAYALLDKLIEFAWDCHDVNIRITGHSDASGDESWNLELSRQRAEAVAAYLVRGGVERDRLSVDGKGSAMPIADNSTALGRRLNRRIEFSLYR